MTTPSASQPLVWINGFPGCGKLTVATILKTLYGAAILLDNHKLIDPVEATFPRDHPDYQKERQLYRKSIFNEYVCDVSSLAHMIIFTDFQSRNELGRNVATEYRDAAQKAGRPFIAIYLVCDIDENVKRLSTPHRINSGTKKLTNTQLLRDFYSRCDLFRFEQCLALTIDTTNMSPQETAMNILTFIKRNVPETSAENVNSPKVQV